MEYNNYEEFFHQVLGNAPYQYQRRLAEDVDWPMALHVGTGLGKSAAVVLAWLWRRRFAENNIRQRTPRRLVYCLPQRALVTQTAIAIRRWLEVVGLDADMEPAGLDEVPVSHHADSAKAIPVHVMMGGNLAADWDEDPEADMVIVGTQDQLLSRALGKGYGMSRFRWPMHFALLNSDCLWIVDEPQLFQNGLATTAQLQAFRNQFGTYGTTQTLWMSATLQRDWLRTIDFREKAGAGVILELGQNDEDAVGRLLQASKPIRASGITLTGKMANNPKDYAKEVAEFIRNSHVEGTMTLCIVNRVNRAQAIYKELLKETKVQSKVQTQRKVLLVHSRYRLTDRQRITDELLANASGDLIVVATQAVEAGIDVSARTLITELAPWSSVVQRLGRCNRYGEWNEAQPAAVYWIDVEGDISAAAPYEMESLSVARANLAQTTNARIANLPPVEEGIAASHVLRKRDLLELFDNTADLSGNDIDISPYVRGVQDTDISVYWRSWDGENDLDVTMPGPHASEICRISIANLKTFLDKKHSDLSRQANIWDSLRANWRTLRAGDIRPGQVILLRDKDGGYTPDLGFDADSWDCVERVQLPPDAAFSNAAHDSEDDNGRFTAENPILLGTHLLDVAAEARRLVEAFPDVKELDLLPEAALHHDWGKAMPPFQGLLKANLPKDSAFVHELLAKSFPIGPEDKRKWTTHVDAHGLAHSSAGHPDAAGIGAAQADIVGEPAFPASREQSNGGLNDVTERSAKGFRHELASALGYLQTRSAADVNERSTRLVAYLIAAHHGKVRMAIRSVLTETIPKRDILFARGVWDGDPLPEVQLPTGQVLPEVNLSLQFMKGGWSQGETEQPVKSWLSGTLDLLEAYGPFRLAWIETLFRIADWRASRKEVETYGSDV